MKQTSRLTLIVFLLIALPRVLIAENTVLRTGHTGAVQTFSYNGGENLLFSGGADGTIRIWNTTNGELEKRIQVSHLPIRMTSVHPSLPRVAFLETDGINTFIISAWDYSENRRVFIHRLQEMPLFLSYSPRGTYLVYGKTDWDSLRFLDGDSGRRISGLDEGFGIVSAVFFSASEKTLLTYGSSGSIQYWDLETKERKTRLSTEKELRQIFFSSNGRFMIGENRETVFLLDLVSGKTLDTVQGGLNTALAFNGSSDTLLILSRGDRRLVNRQFTIADGKFSLVSESSFPFPEAGFLAASGGSAWYIGTDKGDIYTFRPIDRAAEIFVSNRLLDIDDLAAGPDFLALSGPEQTILVSLESLASLSTGTPFYRPITYSHPFPGRAGLTWHQDGTLFVWRKELEGTIYSLKKDGGFVRSLSVCDAPIQNLVPWKDTSAVLLDRNDTLRVISTEEGRELFSYSSFGIRTVVPVAGEFIMAGRNKTSALSAPLLLINPRTGETVPIDGEDIVTLDLYYDSRLGVLYSLGIEERSGTLKTVLKAHTGNRWEISRTLFAFSGEDHSSSFTVDVQDSTIFTSIGYGHVRMYRWGGFTSLQPSSRIPEKLRASGGYLFSLNKDNTVVVWDARTGRIVTELFFFTDGTSAAVGPHGTLHAPTLEDRPFPEN